MVATVRTVVDPVRCVVVPTAKITTTTTTTARTKMTTDAQTERLTE